MKDRLTAIGPLDGRYREKVDALSAYFSEHALFRARIEVEARYLLALSDLGVVRSFSAKEKAQLSALYAKFDTSHSASIKKIEATTRHDVKAVEYWLKDQLRKSTLKDVLEYVHFGLTSTDTDNIAYGLLTDRGLKNVLLPALDNLIRSIASIAASEQKSAMLARTHGQPAVPTTLGKEFAVYAMRLLRQRTQLLEYKSMAKLNGAVGNYNALVYAAPTVDWIAFSQQFLSSLDLETNLFTTQIEPHDRLAELFDIMRRINGIIIDLDRDCWLYIAQDLLILKKIKGEVGSSTMPQKVNPIDFENSEGNAKVASSLLEGIGRELQISRLQRDLSDTTVLRNSGVVFGHCLLAYLSTLQGLGKVSANHAKIAAELDAHYEVLAEGFQTILRTQGASAPYERLKEAVRGKTLGKAELAALAKTLTKDPSLQERLSTLTPQTYIGEAEKLTALALKRVKQEVGP